MVCELELRETATALAIERLEARKEQLEGAVTRLHDFYAHAPIPFVTFDATARIRKLNAAAEGMLRVSAKRAIGFAFSIFVRDSSCAAFLAHLRQCRRANGGAIASEIDVTAGEQTIPVQLVSCRVPTEEGELFETALIDLSKQKAAAVALQRAWEYAEAIVTTIPYPVLVLDANLRILRANKAFIDLFHVSEIGVRALLLHELLGVRWSYPGIEPKILKAILHKGQELRELVVDAYLSSGATLILQVNARRLTALTGMEPMLLICFEDITRRKRAEQEREKLVVELEGARHRLEASVNERTEQLAESLAQLRDVSEKLVLAHESEQRRIARELHDQIGQDLTALRLMFHRAAADEANPARATFADAVRVTEEAIQNIRAICGTLRPQALDDLGLIAGLKWHFDTFGARFKVRVEFELGPFDETRVNDILQCTIFRVIQEALTNVARHSGADRARVALSMTEDQVLLQISDRGKGFKLQNVEKSRMGLSSMRERVSLMNGGFVVKTRPGRGTSIDVTIPITFNPR